MSAGGFYCCLCLAPARPGSVQPSSADDARFATGVCSGEHQYQAKDPRHKLPDPATNEIPNKRQRRVGMVWRDTPPDPSITTPRTRRRAAPSLPLFGVTPDA